MLDKLTKNLIKEIENKKRDVMIDNHGSISWREAEETALDEIMTDINNASDVLYDFVQYLLDKEGYDVGNMNKNIFQQQKTEKSEAQTSFEKMMGVSDLSQLLSIRG